MIAYRPSRGWPPARVPNATVEPRCAAGTACHAADNGHPILLTVLTTAGIPAPLCWTHTRYRSGTKGGNYLPANSLFLVELNAGLLPIAAHLLLFPLVAALPAPSWARAAGYGWLVINMVSDIMALNGVPGVTDLPLRYGGHVAAALWIGAFIEPLAELRTAHPQHLTLTTPAPHPPRLSHHFAACCPVR